MKLFGSTKKLIGKTKTGENVQKSPSSFNINKNVKYCTLLHPINPMLLCFNVETSNLVFLKTYYIVR